MLPGVPCLGFDDAYSDTVEADWCGGKVDGTGLFGCDADRFNNSGTSTSDADRTADTGTYAPAADCSDPNITCTCSRTDSDGYTDFNNPFNCLYIRAVGTCD